METEAWIQVQTTVANEADARRLARGLVEQQLAACVQVHAGVHSTYRWQGEIEEANEWLLVAKTHRNCWTRLETWIASEHPYDCPELIALPLIDVARSYRDWLAGQLPPQAS